MHERLNLIAFQTSADRGAVAERRQIPVGKPIELIREPDTVVWRFFQHKFANSEAYPSIVETKRILKFMKLMIFMKSMKLKIFMDMLGERIA